MPGISRTLLTYRLKELEQVGVIATSPNPNGRGSLYALTKAGNDLNGVMLAMGSWGERWLELGPPHLDPGVVLDSGAAGISPAIDCRHTASWCGLTSRTAHGRAPSFDASSTRASDEVCRTNPGFDEDLVVTAASKALAEWHLGRLSWADAIRAGHIDVAGPPRLVKELPTWNRQSGWARLSIVPEGGAGVGGAPGSP